MSQPHPSTPKASPPSPTANRRDLLKVGGFAAAAAMLTSPRAIFAAPRTATRLQGDAEQDVELQLPFDPFGQEVELHPHRAPNWGPFWVLLPYVWSGLLRFDQNGAVVLDLAESLEPNEDGSVWTAKLRGGLQFASGNAVTAEAAINSWKLALSSTSPAPMSTFMEPLQGFDEFVAGTSTELGVEATDERTITFTLAGPTSSFPAYLATFGWAIIDPELAGSTPAESLPFADAGAGQWRFVESDAPDQVVMEPNPNYWDDASPSVTRLVWRVLDGPDAQSTALDWYRNDEIGVVDVPLGLLAMVNEDTALAEQVVTIENPASVLAIGMDFRQPPFDDVRVRQAVAKAIDRPTWANTIWSSGFLPATSFTPPAVRVTAEYSPPAWPEFDAAGAKSALEAIDPPVTEGLVDVVYYQSATDNPADIDRHAQLLQMIQDNSGLVIRQDATKTAEQIASLQADNGGRQFDLVWWWTVTDTPFLLDTAANPTGPGMTGWFNWSPELTAANDFDPGKAATTFSDLMTQARAQTDAATRNETYGAGEQLLVDNMVYIPLGYWVQRFLRKPWLQGTRQGPWSGGLPVAIDKDVVVSGR